jgi:SAM-dependent methyltransferase
MKKKKAASRVEKPRVDLNHPVLRLFRYTLPLQVKVQEVARVLGDPEGMACLNIGDEGCAMSYQLRRLGGSWESVVADEQQAVTVRELVDEGVHVWDNKALPFENKQFDMLVIIDFMERVEDDTGFIEECHRVLKPDGRLVLLASNAKPWSPVYWLRRLLGVDFEQRGLRRLGYTESDLFNRLKHGFDLNNMRTFSRFWVQLADAIVLGLGPRPVGTDEALRATRRYMVANVFYRLAYQLDMFLVFVRGFSLVVTAKRRAWLPRKTPVLADGRSISEAVLSRAAT